MGDLWLIAEKAGRQEDHHVGGPPFVGRIILEDSNDRWPHWMKKATNAGGQQLTREAHKPEDNNR